MGQDSGPGAARRAWRVWLAALVLVFPVSLATAAGDTDIRDLRQGVLALQQVRARIGHELSGLQGDGRLTTVERRETRLFLAFLLARIREDCRRLLAAGGGPAVAGLDCPAGGAALPGQGSTAARTSGEEVELLDRQLASGLAEFDDMLLAEEQRLAARVPRQGESAGGRDGGGPAGSGFGGGKGEGRAPGGGQGAQAGGDSGPAAGAGQAAESGARRSGTGAGTAASGGRPPDAGSMAADDDIVARQLREAAEKETDPELKKRLWEEYRKYKAQR